MMVHAPLLSMPAACFVSFILTLSLVHAFPFQYPVSRISSRLIRSRTSRIVCQAGIDNSEDLKAELKLYLEKRKEANADEAAKDEVGKVVGGTKGNLILDYVSGAPNKEFVIEDEPNIFDYDQLTKYGFGHLVTPIMDAGGRREMYNLLGMIPPPLPARSKPKKAKKLVIDKNGETDQARYGGLKMGQVLNDDEMARALEEAQKKEKAGQRLKPKLEEEDYEQPFADKRNVGPRLTPDWTPEMLDEEGRKRGQAIAWARKAKAGEFIKDPFEDLSVEGSLRLYCVVSAFFVSFAFGASTPSALSMIGIEDSTPIVNVLKAPALAIVVAALGSSVVSSVVFAPPKNRSKFTWAIKGLFGGPLAIMQLRELDALTTRGEE